MTPRSRPGWSLVEVVVGIAILGLFMGLTASAIHQVRQSAERSRCLNLLRQQGLALLVYESQHGHLPPGALSGPEPIANIPEGVCHGLWPSVLAELGFAHLAARYVWTASFDHPLNAAVIAEPIPVLLCPRAMNQPAEAAPADYGPVDVNPFLADLNLIDPVTRFEGALPVNGRVKLGDLTDGASQTLLVVEAPAGNAWASPATRVGVRELAGVGRHGGGLGCVFADGSSRFLKPNLDVRVLARLATRAGGESLAEGDY